MIIKNVKYSETEGVTVANFGNGTIQMTVGTTHDKQYHVLFLKSQTPHEIGSTKEHGFRDSDDMEPDVALQFSNVESLDAFMSSLEEVRDQFKAQ